MIRVRLTLEDDGAVCLESPFDRSFVDGLKAAIDYGGRQWHPERKRWIVSALYVDALLGYLTQVGAQVQDDRPQGGPAVAVPPMPPELRQAFDTLFLAYNAPLLVAEATYKVLSKVYHPDVGGQAEHFYAINDAIETIRYYVKPKPTEDDDSEIPF
jgi:hypothetical protein